MGIILYVCLFWIIYNLYRKFTRKRIELDNQSVVLITGCSRGLGQRLAQKLIREFKCQIINISRTPPIELFDSLSPSLRKLVHHFECDVADSKNLAKTLNQIRSRFKIPDLIINNAGQSGMSYFLEDNDESSIQHLLKVNSLAPMQITRFFMKEHMKRNAMTPKFTREIFGVQKVRSSSLKTKPPQLKIAFISSIVSEQAVLRFGAYSISKATLQSFVNNLRMEMTHFNLNDTVKLISILPGAFNSKMFHFFQNFLIVRNTPIDTMSENIYQSILNQEEITYLPSYFFWLSRIPDFLIPTKYLDKLFLLVSRQTLGPVTKTLKSDMK